ncbi:hypothetical protein KC19_2G157800 [Ceratodon purpureus]|uniref:Uncharacterized protein n=1 Tax=Ceratodon purpureus TaxID=3225 RepID=A0A8T0IXC4_CERPU|nr:hypothetical protein KC19_2G157800 [Ceratodon purpureus]
MSNSYKIQFQSIKTKACVRTIFSQRVNQAAVHILAANTIRSDSEGVYRTTYILHNTNNSLNQVVLEIMSGGIRTSPGTPNLRSLSAPSARTTSAPTKHPAAQTSCRRGACQTWAFLNAHSFLKLRRLRMFCS